MLDTLQLDLPIALRSRRLRSRRLLLALALLAPELGCRPRFEIEADLRPGDLLLLAHETQGGEIDEVTIRRVPDGALELGAERTMIFAFEERSLSAPGGARLDPDTLEASLARRTEGCGRCLLPGLPAPLLMSPGERCPPPEWARRFELVPSDDGSVIIREDPPSAESVAAQVRFGPPGACPAPVRPVSLDSAKTLEIEPFDESSAAPWPIGAFALASDGTLALLDQRYAKILDAGGRPLSETTALPFTGSIQGAVALGSSFLVMSRTSYRNEPADRPGRVRFDLLGRDLESNEILASSEIGMLVEARRLVLAGSAIERSLGLRAGAGVLVSGKVLANEASIVLACEVGPQGRLAGCQDIGRGTVFSGGIDALTVTDEGVVVLVDNDGARDAGIVHGTRAGGAWRWSRSEIGGTVDDVSSAAGRVVACGSRAGKRAVWTSSISAALLAGGGTASWSLRFEDRAGDACRLGPLAPGRLVATWRLGSAAAVNPDTGEVAEIDLAPLLGGARPRRFESSGARTVIADDCGNIHAGTSSAVTLVHAWSTAPCAEALETREDGSIRGYGRGIERVFAPSASEREIAALPERIDAAAWDACSGTTLLGSPQGVHWLRDGVLIESDEKPLSAKRIFALAPCVRVVIAGGLPWLERAGKIEVLALPPGERRGGATCLTDGGARGGVAWLGGSCGFFRLVLGDTPRVDEPVITSIPSPRPRPDAIRVLDPDHVVFIDADATLWEIAPDGSDRRLTLRSLSLVSGEVDALLGDERALIGVGWDHELIPGPGQLLLAGSAIRGGFAGVTSAAPGPDRDILLLAYGRLLRLSPRSP